VSLNGSFHPPGDKSLSHRIALMSLLARGGCRVANFSPCADVASSIHIIRLLGVVAEVEGGELILRGPEISKSRPVHLDCGNSGTTMRLAMGILVGRPGGFILDGDGSLRRRPMERVASPLRTMGAHVETTSGTCPIRITGGPLQGIEFTLPVPSAQIKSAVLLAGIQADGSTVVREPIASRDHTERLLALFGGRIDKTQDGWRVERSSLLFPDSFHVPGDASSAAFFLCAAAVTPGSEVTAERVLLNPTRTGFLDILQRMGADLEIETQEHSSEPWGRVTARFSPHLAGCHIDEKEIPSLVDEVPILALAATQAKGKTIFHGVSELRLKESDRLRAIATQLGAMGAKTLIEEDSLSIEGPTPLTAPLKLDSFKDHRIAMMLRLAGLLAKAEPVIEGEESVVISYPGFHNTLRSLLR
jgi:3-phosphoshikimate 1-carboxyvinyltransferase